MAAQPGTATVTARYLVHLAVVFVPAMIGVLWLAGGLAAALSGTPAISLVVAAGLYLAAHVVRAVRLAVLSARLLGLSARSAALLHLVTSPGTLILPFKLGEILRLHQLWYLGRSLPSAVVVVLLERLFDGVMLLILLVAIYGAGASQGAGLVPVFATTSLAVVAAMVVVVLGPGALRSVQRYIVIHHRRRQSIRHLGRIDFLRGITLEAADLLRSQGAALAVLSALIWGLEVLASSVLVVGVSESPAIEGLVLMTERLLGTAGSGGVWGALGLATMLLVWPVAVWFYLPRVRFEPLRAGKRYQSS